VTALAAGTGSWHSLNRRFVVPQDRPRRGGVKDWLLFPSFKNRSCKMH